MKNTTLWENENSDAALLRLTNRPVANLYREDNPLDNQAYLQKRYDTALLYLPFPAAFNEAISVLRMDIRQQRKNKENYQAHLDRLYQLAVWFSFCDISYVPEVPCVGYFVFEHIVGSKITSLPFSYDEIGYEKLPSLGKSDIKLLVEHYGEPKNHSTLNEKYQHLWTSYIEKMVVKQREIQVLIKKGHITFDDQELRNNPLKVNNELRNDLFCFILE